VCDEVVHALWLHLTLNLNLNLKFGFDMCMLQFSVSNDLDVIVYGLDFMCNRKRGK
jgi:hypothetical protein